MARRFVAVTFRFRSRAASLRREINPILLLMLFAGMASTSVYAQVSPSERYRNAIAAREAKDYPRYVEEMTAALDGVPGHAILLRHLAAGHAFTGETDEAISTLRRVAATGAYFALSADEAFASLRALDAYEAVERIIDNNLKPIGEGRVALRIPDPHLIPEGIAYDPRQDVYFVSSVHRRKIVRVTNAGEVSDFSVGQEDFYAGLGMSVDTERHRLWALSAAFEGMQGFHPDLDGYSSVSCFDLDKGKRTFHLVLTNEDRKHSLNDLTLDSSGGLYITDSASGAIYRLAPGADSLTTLLPAGSLRGPNGIALDEARGLLYVSQWGWDVVYVELATGSVNRLLRPDNVAMYGVDGLYFFDGSLIAIQNDASLDRVVRFSLDRTGKRVFDTRILARRLEAFDEPTTGVILGNELLLIANSQIERFIRSSADPNAAFEDTRILALSL